jgi:catechol 2,3-dioxygenase-like lactoylglutathione lyase family enzyme
MACSFLARSLSSVRQRATPIGEVGRAALGEAMPGWYARPVLAVRDAAAALDFYVERLGFKADWRYEEAGRLRIMQVSRDGCELILSDQWPDDAGQARIFVSLEAADFERLAIDAAERGLALADGHWGYPLKVVEDPDGNRLWFPVPAAQQS